MAKVISNLQVVLGANVRPFVNAFRSAGGAASGLMGALDSATRSILHLTGIAAGLYAIKEIFGGIRDNLQLASDLEQNAIAFEVMLKSGQKAADMMEELRSFAIATPFRFPDVVSGAKQLLAFGVEAQNIIPTMRMLGDVSSGTGADFTNIVHAYGQVAASTRLTGYELREFVQNGVPLITKLSDMLGVPKDQIRKMTEEGKIGFPIIQKAFAEMTGSGGQFEGMMKRLAKTYGGLWSNLADNISLTAADITMSLLEAFGMRQILSTAVDRTTYIGQYLVAAVRQYVPIIIRGFWQVWGVVSQVFNQISAFVTPIVTAIGQYIKDNWKTILDSAVTLWGGVYDAFTGAMRGIWDITLSVWDGITIAWNAGVDYIGESNLRLKNGSAGMFTALADVSIWFAGFVGKVFTAIGYTLSHLHDVAEFVASSVALVFVKLGNDVAYTFTEVIPHALQVVEAYFLGYFDIIGRAAFNTQQLLKAVWDVATTGKIDPHTMFLPLENQVQAHLDRIKEMAERSQTPLEKALADSAATAAGRFGGGIDKAMADADKRNKDFAANAAKSVKDAMGAFTKVDFKPKPLKPYKETIDNLTDVKEAASAAAKQIKDLEAILTGSAASQRMSFDFSKWSTRNADQVKDTRTPLQKSKDAIAEWEATRTHKWDAPAADPAATPAAAATATPTAAPPSPDSGTSTGGTGTAADVLAQIQSLVAAGNIQRADLLAFVKSRQPGSPGRGI